MDWIDLETRTKEHAWSQERVETAKSLAHDTKTYLRALSALCYGSGISLGIAGSQIESLQGSTAKTGALFVLAGYSAWKLGDWGYRRLVEHVDAQNLDFSEHT